MSLATIKGYASKVGVSYGVVTARLRRAGIKPYKTQILMGAKGVWQYWYREEDLRWVMERFVPPAGLFTVKQWAERHPKYNRYTLARCLRGVKPEFQVGRTPYYSLRQVEDNYIFPQVKSVSTPEVTEKLTTQQLALSFLRGSYVNN